MTDSAAEMVARLAREAAWRIRARRLDIGRLADYSGYDHEGQYISEQFACVVGLIEAARSAQKECPYPHLGLAAALRDIEQAAGAPKGTLK